MPERKWSRMPVSYGPHWFCANLLDRDVADMVKVGKVECSDGKVYFRRMGKHGGGIEPDQGWWLPILDERKTAEVET